jgi:hypothetical protein
MSEPSEPSQSGPSRRERGHTERGHTERGHTGCSDAGCDDAECSSRTQPSRTHSSHTQSRRSLRSQNRRPRSRLARAATLLYPPAWRARYGEEIAVLLDDSGGGAGAVLSLVWRALPAWIWPPEHLHDRAGRMRASLGTVLAAWSALAGISLVFVQLTQFQGFMPAGHPIISWCYAIIDGAVAVSALSAAAGGLPLWLLMLRRARRERRPRDTFYLLLPVIAPAGFLAGLLLMTRLAPHPDGLSSTMFLAVVLAGFAAAAAACAGPILAMSRLRPRGPAVHLAVKAAGAAAASIVLAATASCIAAVGLSLWARDFAAYHQAGQVVGYLTVVVVGAAVATVGATRGVRATLGRAGR